MSFTEYPTSLSSHFYYRQNLLSSPLKHIKGLIPNSHSTFMPGLAPYNRDIVAAVASSMPKGGTATSHQIVGHQSGRPPMASRPRMSDYCSLSSARQIQGLLLPHTLELTTNLWVNITNPTDATSLMRAIRAAMEGDIDCMVEGLIQR